MLNRCLVLVGSLCISALGARAARADIYQEFYGSRSLSMGGAHRGIGTSNETLLLNPAGMAVASRYSVDMQYGYGTGDNINGLSGSAVDSKSGPVAGGVSYTRSWGNPSRLDATLNRVALGFAYKLGQAFALGATAKAIRGGYNTDAGHEDINLYTGTLGGSVMLGDVLSLGVSWENMVKGSAQEQLLAKPVVGIGVGLHVPVASLGADLVVDTRSHLERRVTYHVGGEFIAYELLALRAGYRTDLGESLHPHGPIGHYLTGGVGLVSPVVSINVSAERALVDGGPWQIIGGFALMM